MRYVSEQFKEKQNQLIRPPLKMRFEICTDVINRIIIDAYKNYPFFDTTVVPFAFPQHCANDYYYAVVGDGIGVDDPNRMCAPVDNSGFATPEHTVPMGVSTVVSANAEAMFGSNTFSQNTIGVSQDATISFKGGLIPEQIRVEVYDIPSSTWSTEQTIDNSELSEEVIIPYDGKTGVYHRFFFLNTRKGGRYQLNWIKRDTVEQAGLSPVIFENGYISSVSINETTDLTSQTEPSYDLTVTCLDVNKEYTPDSEYWQKKNQFTDGKTCYISVGYGDELVPMIVGYLTQKPTYDQGKITFKVSAWAIKARGKIAFDSLSDSFLNVGDETKSIRFSSKLGNLFNYYSSVFHDNTDDVNSITNCYDYFGKGNAAKLVANALGGYITILPNSVNLFNTCDIQYKTPVDYLTRYEQVKNTLDSMPKVNATSISRRTNTVSADYVDIEARERVSIPANGSAMNSYSLPFFAFGKAVVIDYQSSVPSATLTTIDTSVMETVREDGEIRAYINIRSNVATTVKPIFRFYRVDSANYEESETIDSYGSEDYDNDNEFVTNTYLADKVKRVAKFMSDVSNQYEVDVVQDIRYELGDVIRLETEKNVFKTCVITGLNFNFPGSKGHVTCRKIFSLMDSAYAVPDPQGSLYVNFPTGGYYYVGKNDGMAIFGTFNYSNRCFFYGLGFSTFTKTPYGAELSINKKLVDLNGHEWGVFFYNVDSSYTTNNPCVIDLPDYDSSSGANANSWGAIELIKALYNEQNMTPPVDYTCTLVNP